MGMVLGLFAAGARSAEPALVLLDTDMGTDIDDAFALALIVRSPELRLIGITTVSGDAPARARLAAKLLASAGQGWASVPVYAGISGPPQSLEQGKWAANFTSPALHLSGGVEFLRRTIDAHPGKITLIAIGELTDAAALLRSESGIAGKVARIVLMGGSVRRGYALGAPPEPEWNIRSNAPAAQAVFASGIPIVMAPLDATADLKMDAAAQARLFETGLPLTDALSSLTIIWRATAPWKPDTPTLFDVMAVALAIDPALTRLERHHVIVEAGGLTRIDDRLPPNAEVALAADPAAFMRFYLGRFGKN